VSQSRSQRDDQYFDDPHLPLKERKRWTKPFLSLSAISAILVLSSTFASNINLNNSAPVEFGQGVVATTACDNSITLTPLASFKNKSSGEFFAFSGVKISGIDGTSQISSTDEGCAGKYFTVKAYGSTGNTPLVSAIVTLNNAGVFASGDGRTAATSESTTNSSVTLTFDEPSVSASNVYKVTLESSAGVINLASITSFPSGIYIASIDNSRNDVTYAIAGSLDINGDFTQCKLYRSNNLGTTWTEVSALPFCFWYMTVSNDGTRLLAADWGGEIYTSSNSGVTWTNRGNPKQWWGFSSSGSGQVVVGITEKVSVHISNDYGQTWSTPAGLTPSGTFTKSAISDDGQKIMILDSYGRIYLSNNSGSTFTQRGEERNWYAGAMSGDGSRLYAAEGMDVGMTVGQIYTSDDFGLTWVPRSINNMWWQMRSSYDGKTVIAMASDKIETVFVSTDYGVTWRRTNEAFYFGDIALSRNGDTIIGSTSSTVFGLLRLHSAKIN
jgi:photosystem II stability/assembly factor-like uncharacterized protein